MAFEIRENRGRAQGRRKLVREREEYLRLVREGLSNRLACEVVGINARTGKRWRNGRNRSGRSKGHHRSLRWCPRAGPSRFLIEADRIHIADRLREMTPIRVIAAGLGRSPSTISREIRRNRHPVNGQYRPHAAQARADARRPRPKQERSERTRNCGRSSRAGWSWNGARNRSARACSSVSPPGRRCRCPTKRSTVRFTFKDAESYAAS
jgi:hypothetical protein